MHDEAASGWLNSFLDGKSTFLLAGSNEEAARLARLARERLAALGKISGADEIVLSDGNAAGGRGPGAGPAQHQDRRGRADPQQPRHDQDRRVAVESLEPVTGKTAVLVGAAGGVGSFAI